MRFFRLHHPDELYVSNGETCVLIMARAGFDDGHKLIRSPTVELESHEIHMICKGCSNEGLSMNFGLCPQCMREVKVK